VDSIGAPKIQKPQVSRVKKPGGNDIDWFNPYGNQTTHFDGYTKNPNVDNSSCNHEQLSHTCHNSLHQINED
jgi:hypothetical protein